MNVYTGLLFLAVIALAAACIFVYANAKFVGGNGDPFTKQVKNGIKIQNSTATTR